MSKHTQYVVGVTTPPSRNVSWVTHLIGDYYAWSGKRKTAQRFDRAGALAAVEKLRSLIRAYHAKSDRPCPVLRFRAVPTTGGASIAVPAEGARATIGRPESLLEGILNIVPEDGT